MDVAGLKRRARELERQERIREALAYYRHILTGLEGTPDLVPELPLYVKAGDLFLKLDNPKAAVLLYERAGKHYAAQGSARSVSAICAKVLRVMPERRQVYHRLAVIMLENGHVGPARAVIEEYIAELHLPAAHRALEALGDAADDAARPVLDMVLDLASRHERASGRMVAVALPALPPEPELIEPPEPEPDAAPEPEALDLVPIGQEVVAEPPPSSEAVTRGADADGVTRPPVDQPEPETETEFHPVGSDLGAEPAPDVEPLASDLAVEPEPSAPARVTPPGRAPFGGSLVFAPEDRRRPRRGRLWVPVGVVGVLGVVGGYALLSGGEADPVVGSMVMATAPESLEPLPTPPETISVVAPDTMAGATGDTMTASPPPAPVDATMPVTIAVPDTGLLGRAIIAVAGLPIERISDVTAGERAGYEVLQTLQNGQRLTVGVLPWRAADTVRLGPVRTRADGASVGSVRFGRYVVDVTARVDPGILRDLMGRLVGRREPGP